MTDPLLFAFKVAATLAIIGAAYGWYWKVCRLVYRAQVTPRSRGGAAAGGPTSASL